MQAKLKHLEFIQDTIKRMSGNSFLLKGWGVTIISALYAVSIKENASYLLVIIPVIIFFWTLDSYFIWQERKFRGLFRKVANLSEQAIDFSMKTKEFNKGRDTWFWSFLSVTFLISYLPLLLLTSFLLITNVYFIN